MFFTKPLLLAESVCHYFHISHSNPHSDFHELFQPRAADVLIYGDYDQAVVVIGGIYLPRDIVE